MSTIARQAQLNIIYKKVNITKDILPYLIGLTYTDKIDSNSPDIDINLEDSRRLWQSSWFPQPQDQIDVKMQYKEDPNVLNAGTFEVDDLVFTFSQEGDRLKLGAQATPVSKNLREVQSQKYENVTLKKIVTAVANRQGLKVVGTIVDVRFERITQNEENDLHFLARLSKDYGQLFKIQGSDLIFYNWETLDAQPSAFTLTRAEITTSRTRKKLIGIYKEAVLYYSKGETNKPVFIKIPANPKPNSKDVLVINSRAETEQQAQLKAKERLRAANADEYTGVLTLEGASQYIAGLNFALEGFGSFDGVWQIQEARHAFDQRGWTTRLDVRRIREGSN